MFAICCAPTQLYSRAAANDPRRGVIRPPHSAYASACHTVRKKDGTVRVVQDFRGLNALLKEQSGGLGNLTTIFDEMGGSNCFTCLDVASGFLKLTTRESDRHLTAFATRQGSYGSTFGVDSGSRRYPRRSQTTGVGN